MRQQVDKKGRAHDVLDILLIDLLRKMDAKAVRAAAKHVFKQRAMHKFPPEIKLPEEWRPGLEALAKELGYPVTSAAKIEVRFHNCVAGRGNWDRMETLLPTQMASKWLVSDNKSY